MLTYYEPIANFDSAIVFTNCNKMYDTLLDEWFLCQVIRLMKEKHAIDMKTIPTIILASSRADQHNRRDAKLPVLRCPTV